MLKRPMLSAALLASASLLAMTGATWADDGVQAAKDYIKKVTAPVTTWDGPTTGPKASGHKLIVYVSTDQRNGGARGVGMGIEQAAKVLGWEVRAIDGQGSVNARAEGISQAIALKADGLVLDAIDAAEQASAIESAVKAGIKVVGWHSGAKPGPMPKYGVFTNITTDPMEVAKAAASYAVADSNGKAGAIIFTDSAYAIAIAKSNEMATVIKSCKTCAVLSVQDTPLADAANRMPQLTTSLLQRYGAKWTYALSVNDLTFDFMAPSLQSAGIGGGAPPHAISAGDGSEPAFQRIRSGEYQVATVAEPLSLHGWQIVDELNRAFAGDKPSGYVAPPHLFIKANINKDGGPNNVFDPQNGYRDAYKKIWGK
ncbi:MAG: sugar ABC transporter substrate-binding protein [Rhodospirillales bacterium 20-64-7]|nr:MAG: sugar ABC transporter substrate-binding protein [Rhodospirillales bacterium 20-64-7]HQT76338.1 substrate-binding domain-containing protein [Rhodopila sp.]